MQPGDAGKNARRLVLLPALILAGCESVVAALIASAVLVVAWTSVGAPTRVVVVLLAWVPWLYLVTSVLRWLWRIGSESTPTSLALLVVALAPVLTGRALVSMANDERLSAFTTTSLSSASDPDVERCFATLSSEDVLRKARRAAGSEVWANDVVHDAMIAVCMGFRNVRNLEAYFVTAVQNAARKAREGQWRPGLCPVARCPAPDADVRLEHLEFARAVMCKLTPEEASLLELYADGARYRELAERLQITEPTARQRVKRIRERLRQQYADCNPWK